MSDKNEKFPVPELLKRIRKTQQFRGILAIKHLAEDSNSIDLWMKEEGITVGTNQVKSSVAYTGYAEWCNQKQLDKKAIATHRAFGDRLKDAHHIPDNQTGNNTYYSLSKSLSQYEEKAKEKFSKKSKTQKKSEKDPS